MTARKCTKNVCCTCKVVGVLLIKAGPVAFLTFSLLETMTATSTRTTKTPLGLSKQNKNLIVHFFVVVARLRRKTDVAFCGGREHKTTIFFFSFCELRFNTVENNRLRQNSKVFDNLIEMEFTF